MASAGRSRRDWPRPARASCCTGAIAEALQSRAAELGRNAGTLAFDVTDAAAVRAAFGRIQAEHGRLDILVNNAGIIPRKPVLETTDEDWQAVIDSNLTAYFRLVARGGATDGAGETWPHHHGLVDHGPARAADHPRLRHRRNRPCTA